MGAGGTIGLAGLKKACEFMYRPRRSTSASLGIRTSATQVTRRLASKHGAVKILKGSMHVPDPTEKSALCLCLDSSVRNVPNLIKLYFFLISSLTNRKVQGQLSKQNSWHTINCG